MSTLVRFPTVATVASISGEAFARGDAGDAVVMTGSGNRTKGATNEVGPDGAGTYTAYTAMIGSTTVTLHVETSSTNLSCRDRQSMASHCFDGPNSIKTANLPFGSIVVFRQTTSLGKIIPVT